MAGALDAAKAGVNAVHIIDGRVPHAMLLEILTEQTYGTTIHGPLAHCEHSAQVLEAGTAIISIWFDSIAACLVIYRTHNAFASQGEREATGMAGLLGFDYSGSLAVKGSSFSVAWWSPIVCWKAQLLQSGYSACPAHMACRLDRCSPGLRADHRAPGHIHAIAGYLLEPQTRASRVGWVAGCMWALFYQGFLTGTSRMQSTDLYRHSA